MSHYSFLASPAQGGPFNRLLFHYESSGEDGVADVEVAQSSSIDDGAECEVALKKADNAPYHSVSKYFVKFLLQFGKY